MNRFLALIVLCAALPAARVARAQPQAAGARESLVLCLAADALHEPIWPTRTFPASGKQLVCVFRLADDESFTKVTSKWIAVDVGAAAPANTEIGQSDLPLQGRKGGKLRFVLPRPLPVGKYRLDVLADGKPWKSIEMAVAADVQPPPVDAPQALFALAEGKTWTYDFVQQAGPGAKVSAAGEKIDPDGKLRATVTLTVGKTDETGHEIVVRRNGKTMVQEWWKVDGRGLQATRRKTDAESIGLDPPQPLLPLTRDAYHAWTYAPKDGSFTQSGQLWAALPIKSPFGEKPGYLTVMEQSTPLGKITVERHFIPGVGMVRETVTSSIGPRLLSRQMMTLVAPAR